MGTKRPLKRNPGTRLRARAFTKMPVAGSRPRIHVDTCPAAGALRWGLLVLAAAHRTCPDRTQRRRHTTWCHHAGAWIARSSSVFTLTAAPVNPLIILFPVKSSYSPLIALPRARLALLWRLRLHLLQIYCSTTIAKQTKPRFPDFSGFTTVLVHFARAALVPASRYSTAALYGTVARR